VRGHASDRGDVDGLGVRGGRQSTRNTEDHLTSRYRSAFGATTPALVRPTGTATPDRATSERRRADRRALRPGMITNIALVSVYCVDQTPRAFYIDILGFEVRTDVTMGDGSAS